MINSNFGTLPKGFKSSKTPRIANWGSSVITTGIRPSSRNKRNGCKERKITYVRFFPNQFLLELMYWWRSEDPRDLLSKFGSSFSKRAKNKRLERGTNFLEFDNGSRSSLLLQKPTLRGSCHSGKLFCLKLETDSDADLWHSALYNRDSMRSF